MKQFYSLAQMVLILVFLTLSAPVIADENVDNRASLLKLFSK